VDLHVFFIGALASHHLPYVGELVFRHALDRGNVCAIRFERGGPESHAVIKHLELRGAFGLLDPERFFIGPEGWVYIRHPI
jgi:hypothetical protein